MPSKPDNRNPIARVTPTHLLEKHGCNWPTCKQQVPKDTWGCRNHWYALPREIRREIWKAYDPNEPLSEAYIKVFREAEDWIRENHPELFRPAAPIEHHSKGALFEDPFEDE